MGAEAGSSLLLYVGLVGGGFVLGRMELLPMLLQLVEELEALSWARKALLMGSFLGLLTLYIVGLLWPLSRIAEQEAALGSGPTSIASPHALPQTSFRRELRRRGSYSMSYVTDIKAHVFARS